MAMKNKSVLGLIAFLFGLSLATTSCEDMLTPDMNRTSEGFSGKDTVNFYWGILRNVQGMIEQNVLLGDIRGDLADTTMYSSDSIADIANFKRTADGENALLNRSAYYKVINQCNFYLDKADTMAVKNNVRFMRREWAQVMLIRAWTYMQLVQNYGRVPYITRPVSTANTGWETNPEAWATPENLLDLVIKDCERAQEYERAIDGGFPNYGGFENGSGVKIAHSSMIFPADLVMADLYLLRGASKADYVEAAKLYYRYLNEHGLTVSVADAAPYAKIGSRATNTPDNYQPQTSSWARLFSASSDAEIITVLPSAANSAFGLVLTDVPQVYGFDPHSTNSTFVNERTTDTGTDDVASSGQVSIVANYKNRQIAPSARYTAINRAQTPIFVELNASSTALDQTVRNIEYLTNGDARFYGTAPEVRTEIGRLRFIQKYGASNSASAGLAPSTAFSFRYVLGVYRVRQVYLRFAEALNRAGYPRHAFAVLRGGLDAEKIPALTVDTVYDDETKTKWPVTLIDSVENGVNFINADELRRAQASAEYPLMLDFTEDTWDNFGIHDLGNGRLYDADTVNTYEKMVGARIQQEQLRRGASPESVRKLLRRLHLTGRVTAKAGEDESETDPEEPTEEELLAAARATYTILDEPEPVEPDPLEIDAVECLIADECALETAFEGYRYYDLMRFARHKNLDANLPAGTGTSWFAWQIARRGINVGLYEDVDNYDRALYNLLLEEGNWYLRNPEY